MQLASVMISSVPSGGLCWFLHPTSPPMSACVCLPYMEWLQLRGMWLAIGQSVLLACRLSVHSWFPFFRAPYPSLSAHSSCSHARGHTQHTQSKGACSYISPQLSLWPFSGRLLSHLPQKYPHTVHTGKKYRLKAFVLTLQAKTLTVHRGEKHLSCLAT